MYGPACEPKPIEKIRVVKWSNENTAKTQAIVNELHQARLAVMHLAGENSRVAASLKRAVQRFHAIDAQIKLPAWDYER